MENTTTSAVVEIDKELYKDLKIYCVLNGITLKSILTDIADKGLRNLLKS